MDTSTFLILIESLSPFLYPTELLKLLSTNRLVGFSAARLKSLSKVVVVVPKDEDCQSVADRFSSIVHSIRYVKLKLRSIDVEGFGAVEAITNVFPNLHGFTAPCLSIDSWLTKRQTIRELDVSDFSPYRSNLTTLLQIPLIFPNLESLSFAKSLVQDISPLISVPTLKHLSLSNTRVHDLTPLKHLIDLVSLDLGHSQVTDISALCGLQKLESISLDYVACLDFSPLQSLKLLRKLRMRNCCCLSFDFLRGLCFLEYLDISFHFISDVGFLQKVPTLRHLEASLPNIHDASAIRHLPLLQSLNLSNSKIDNIEFLRDMTNLTSLDIARTNVADLTPLLSNHFMHSLRVLQLSFTKIRPESVDVLIQLNQLRVLNLRGTKVSVAPLASLCNLQELLT